MSNNLCSWFFVEAPPVFLFFDVKIDPKFGSEGVIESEQSFMIPELCVPQLCSFVQMEALSRAPSSICI